MLYRQPPIIVGSPDEERLTADVYLHAGDGTHERGVVTVTAPLADDGGIPDFQGIAEAILAERTPWADWGASDWAAR
jgi:hypothetical protein